MHIDRTVLRDKLEARRAELAAQEAMTEGERAPVELDQTSVGRLSRIDAMQVQAMAVAGQKRRLAELARIEAALRRISDEDFGYCSVCGEEIAAGRLEHDPSVTTCIHCAR